MRRRTLGALFAVSATALATLTLPSPARAEMVYRMATMGEPKTLDPHGVSGTWENYIVGDAFMGLLTDAADATPIPGAAESWTISDDGLTYTFKLRDHKWSDGTPVTAEDFVYSLAAHARPGNWQPSTRRCIYPVKNAETINYGQDQGPHRSSASKAIDDKTLEVTLEEPDRLLPRAADALHLLPGAQARHREVRVGLGQARQHRQQWRLHGSSSGRPTRRS